MPLLLLTKIEAAMRLGVGTELLDYFVSECPKPGESRKLGCTLTGTIQYFNADELRTYQAWLRLPWPKPKKGQRPHIPKAIKDDIKRECHFGCAICGHMENGEVAHIDAVADSMDNSPWNLILLCPNHHTKYDYGFKPSNNITTEVVSAAKLVKQDSRRRGQQYEANCADVGEAFLRRVSELEAQLNADIEPAMIQAMETEVRWLLKSLPSAIEAAEVAAKADKALTKHDNPFLKRSKKLGKATIGISDSSSSKDVRSASKAVAAVAQEIFIDLDEEPCPHCGGSGMTGLRGTVCAYCEGDQTVTLQKLKKYVPTKIDEVECPHCDGRGQVGLVGDICSYCNGDQRVTQADHDAYDPKKLDETECPFCQGRGTYGMRGDICPVCDGRQVVGRAAAKSFKPKDVDLVDCPHCKGRGETGLVNDVCAYCGGSCLIPKDQANEYNRDEIDEVDCPRCNGSGQIGLNGNLCSYCGGSCVVTAAQAEEFDESSLDEVECPHCRGKGQTGLRGTMCKFCKGDQVVSPAKADAYQKKYGDRERP